MEDLYIQKDSVYCNTSCGISCVPIMCHLNIQMSLHSVICHLSVYSYARISSVEYRHQVVLQVYCMICSLLNGLFSCNLYPTVNTQTRDNVCHGNHSIKTCATQ
jgi:hypothetical protein